MTLSLEVTLNRSGGGGGGGRAVVGTLDILMYS